MLYPDPEIVKRLRQEDPHGRYSTNALEKLALREQLKTEIEKRVSYEDPLRDIFDTILELL